MVGYLPASGSAGPRDRQTRAPGSARVGNEREKSGGTATLVRQLIGTDPAGERFPSTSTARTSIADMEIVFSSGPFRAAVTFLPRDEVRDYLEESMSAAALAAYQGDPDIEVLRRLL